MISVPLLTTTLTSAEMIKYAANAFLAMKIGFANEIANICERVGAEAPEVMAGIGLDSRIGAKFLNPGVGWGGSCFGKDIQSLLHTAREYGYSSKLLAGRARRQRRAAADGDSETAGEALHPERPHHRLAGPGVQTRYRRFARCARAAYRRAPDADGRARQGLRSRSRCTPAASSVPISKCATAIRARELASDADALVLVTEWREFHDLDLAELARLMANPILIDGRNFFVPDTAIAAGFDYSGIGRCVRGRASQRADSAPATT